MVTQAPPPAGLLLVTPTDSERESSVLEQMSSAGAGSGPSASDPQWSVEGPGRPSRPLII